MALADEAGGLEELRLLEDVKAFMDMYDRATNLPPRERTTFAALFGDDNAYSTIAGQIGRVAAFAARHTAHQTGRQAGRALPRRTGLELLFVRRKDGDGGLQPTDVADALYEEFRTLREVCQNVGPRLSEQLGRVVFPRDVRVGASQNMGYFILPFCLSNWKDCFGSTIRLSLEVNHTWQLLPRLDAGLLDFVVGYGRPNEKGIVQDRLRVAFSAFSGKHSKEFESEFLLVCHPKAELRHDGRDANKGYWLRRWDEGQKKPILDDLEPLDPEKIDFRGTTLIVCPTWNPPPGIEKLEERAKQAGAKLWRVNGYEEAAALIRCNLGHAVLPQVFSTRRMLTAFRLEPTDQFLRWIGAYYSTHYSLSEEAYKVLAFISSYMDIFRVSLRAGKPACIVKGESPGEDKQNYPDWSTNFQVEGDWMQAAMRDYPLPRKRSGHKGKKSDGAENKSKE